MVDLNEAKEQQSLRYFLMINCSPENAKSNGSHRNGSAFKQKKSHLKKCRQRRIRSSNIQRTLQRWWRNWIKTENQSLDRLKKKSFLVYLVKKRLRLSSWTNRLLRMKKTWQKKWMHPSKKIDDQWTYQYLICLIIQNLTVSCWSDSAIANLFFAITVLKHTVEQTHIFFYI